MRTTLTVVATAIAFAAFALTAAAQDGKKSKQPLPPQAAGSWPICQGMVWDGQQCLHPSTRKVCTMRVGTSGQAHMTDCK
jgi:hypothetical protein